MQKTVFEITVSEMEIFLYMSKAQCLNPKLVWNSKKHYWPRLVSILNWLDGSRLLKNSEKSLSNLMTVLSSSSNDILCGYESSMEGAIVFMNKNWSTKLKGLFILELQIPIPISKCRNQNRFTIVHIDVGLKNRWVWLF